MNKEQLIARLLMAGFVEDDNPALEGYARDFDFYHGGGTHVPFYIRFEHGKRELATVNVENEKRACYIANEVTYGDCWDRVQNLLTEHEKGGQP